MEEAVPSHQAPPEEHKIKKPINVLVVGETQQGKSTLVSQLCRYAGIRNVDIPIGYGNVKCTKVVNQYEIEATLCRYRLIDPLGKEIKGLSYAGYCDLTEEEAKAVPAVADSEPTVNFLMIDTPGLDDSEGDDYDIMAGIIGTVGTMEHVNAVIYVRNMGKPFSASFKRFFGYIQRCMPAVSNGLIIINTSFTVDKNEQFISKRKNLANIRREAFTAATGLDLQHFFMDNEPDRNQPFAVLQSLNETYRLLHFLSFQEPLETASLKLLKTAKMMNYDAYIINELLERKNALEKEWTAEKAHASTRQQASMITQRQITKIKKRLETKRTQVEELSNGPDVNLGRKSCVEDYSFVGNLLFKGNLNLGRRRMEFDAECEITRVNKTCSSGSQWLDEDLRGTSWRAVLTSGLFRDIDGTATFYTTSKIKHRAEIRALRSTIAELEETLEDLEDASLKGGADLDGKVDTLIENVELVDQIIQAVRLDTFAVEIWPRLRPFYMSGLKPSRENLASFVSAYNEMAAKLL